MSDHITLVGNIAGDLEQRATRGGGTIAAFRLAVGERRFDRERGEWVDGHTSFYAVSVFGELGAHVLRSFHKGERVIVNGRLRLREWEAENRRGVSADVTAEAIGHDLRWGVSRFQRIPRGDAPAGEPEHGDAVTAVAAPSAVGAADADGWALPGEAGVDRAPTATGTPSSTVTAPEPAETPF